MSVWDVPFGRVQGDSDWRGDSVQASVVIDHGGPIGRSNSADHFDVGGIAIADVQITRQPIEGQTACVSRLSSKQKLRRVSATHGSLVDESILGHSGCQDLPFDRKLHVVHSEVGLVKVHISNVAQTGQRDHAGNDRFTIDYGNARHSDVAENGYGPSSNGVTLDGDDERRII